MNPTQTRTPGKPASPPPGKPAEGKPADGKPADGKPAEGKPAESKTEPATCGQTYERTVKGGETKSLECGKVKGHDGKHGPAPRKEVQEVPLDVLDSFEDVPGDEYVPVKPRDAERSQRQVKVDAHVKESHAAWVAAGRPKEFNDSPRKRYTFEPGQYEDIVAMLRRAERLHNVRVRIAPEKRHESGKHMIYWVAIDRAARKPEGGAPSDQRQGNGEGPTGGHVDHGQQGINLPKPAGPGDEPPKVPTGGTVKPAGKLA